MADSATVTIQKLPLSIQAFSTISLAEGLAKGRDISLARQFTIEAARLIDSSPQSNSLVRAQTIELLGSFGETAMAEKLVPTGASSQDRLLFLGKLGAGQAEAGDDAAASRSSTAITAIVAGSADGALRSAADRASSEIGFALIAARKAEVAEHIFEVMQDALPKVHGLTELAVLSCQGTPSNRSKGQALAAKAAASGRLALETALPFEKRNLVAESALAVAICRDTSAASALVNEMSPPAIETQSLGRLADLLISHQEMSAARVLSPAPDPANAESMTENAFRLKRLGDAADAKRSALSAIRLLIDAGGNPKRKMLVPPATTLFYLLADLHAYDEMVAVTQPLEASSRMDSLAQVLSAEAKAGDADSLKRTLPEATEAFRQDAAVDHWRAFMIFYSLSRDLARTGFAAEARQTFSELLTVLRQYPSADALAKANWLAVVLRADLGDVGAALASVDQLGPMTERPSQGLIDGLAIASFDGKPGMTAESWSAAQQHVADALKSVSGAKASALAAIAQDLAAQGKLVDASRVVSILNPVNSSALTLSYDSSLIVISDAQKKTGDFRGALRTIFAHQPPHRTPNCFDQACARSSQFLGV